MHVPTRVIRPQVFHKASSPLPTVHGTFEAHVFESDGKEHVAMVFGDVSGMYDVPVRVHSECLTSEVFGSLKCDCKQQLDAALTEIVQRGAGVVLYMRQEGRGIGLANKIRAYQLQTLGADTVDANRMLGLPDDAREYDAVPAMLEHLGVRSVRLMTNNPAKVDGLRCLGVDVASTLPVLVEPSPQAMEYLETKRVRMAHQLPTRFKATGSE